MKYTQEGGAVATTVRVQDGRAEIAVTDNGVGIPVEEQDAVFDDFRRGGSDYTREQQGTGLGLGLARRLVRLMGGDIRLTSAAGSGSTFTVVVPLQYGTASSP